MEDLAILLAAIIFNAGYAATRGGGYNGTVFLISAGVLVVPTAVIAGMEGLCGGRLRGGGGARTEKKQRQEEGETNC